MTLQLPTLLALLGAALLAGAIFVPQKPAQRSAAVRPVIVRSVAAAPAWPELIDTAARHCDATARRGLAAALGALGEPWCAAILARALAEETDPNVRSALAAASEASPSSQPREPTPVS